MYLCGKSTSASFQNLSRVRCEYEQEGLPPSVKPTKVWDYAQYVSHETNR